MLGSKMMQLTLALILLDDMDGPGTGCGEPPAGATWGVEAGALCMASRCPCRYTASSDSSLRSGEVHSHRGDASL